MKYFNIVQQWKTIIVILLRHTDKREFYSLQYQEYIDLVKETNDFCYKTNIIDNTEQINIIVQILKRETIKTPIVLFGPGKDQMDFMHQVEGGIRLKKIWFFNGVYTVSYTHLTLPTILLV